MRIHEYQAKAIFSEYGIPVPKGGIARKAEEASEIASRIGRQVAIKAQVHAGGRGKAGGIKSVSSEKASETAAELLGTRLVTPQTGPEGTPVNSVLVEEAVEVERELYLSVAVDSSAAMPVIIASEEGGMDIEELAGSEPEKIIRVYTDPGTLGFRPFLARKIAFSLNLAPEQITPATELIASLYRLFWEKDCSLAEINPLVVTRDGRLLALDAKINFDDSALYRHKDLVDMRDSSQESPLEVEAKSKGIENYVKLDGGIGIVVNGAGLAMAVMDTIKLAGGNLANFLDIGTTNDPERVVNAFRILTEDPNVRAVLVNIFGGMARVDTIATGLVNAYESMDIRVPVVVRLAGTNIAEGERILRESEVSVIRAKTFREAADKAVAVALGK